MRDQTFRMGQRVRYLDDDGDALYGEVIAVNDDRVPEYPYLVVFDGDDRSWFAARELEAEPVTGEDG